ncbi:MAG: hypothetical protein P8016_05950, partial [Sedimentisphaerales bacterium]
MYRKFIVLMTVVIVPGSIALTGFESRAQAMESSNPSVSSEQQQQMQRNEAIKTSEENLTKARESFLKKDYKTAAQNVRKTVAFMKTEEMNASTSGRKMLASSVNELDMLADNIQKGTVTSVNTLDSAFSRARDAIRSNSQIRTAESQTGRALQSTSSGVKHGLSWTGDKLGAAAS